MKRKFLTTLSTLLEKYCFLLHWTPIGCKMATWSYELDEKYNLGVWNKPESENETKEK
jgi:hypothetical protein